MKCPKCQGKTWVVSVIKRRASAMRRRECYLCKERFNTTEKVVTPPVVEKPDTSHPLKRLWR